jgi:hypothetical protein
MWKVTVGAVDIAKWRWLNYQQIRVLVPTNARSAVGYQDDRRILFQ